jgi:ABC-type phosphonate transport system ATPase subunit
MTIKGIVERIIRGRRLVERRHEIEREIETEKEKIDNHRVEFRGAVRQHAQIVDSSSRVMNTMTQAIIMMEARRGRD